MTIQEQSKKKLLVVDDNLDSQYQIRVMIGTDYELFQAKSGSQALKLCERVKPDLILLDVEMPEMDGFETIARFKNDPYLAAVPVIFLTGSHDPATEIRALDSGAVDFVTKPVNKDILHHRIRLHIELSSYQQALEEQVRELENSLAVSFAEIIERRDANTGGHVVRTGRFVDMLGRKLIEMGLFQSELSEDKLTLIVRGAPLHDIGKIGISDLVLLKPGRLNDEEFKAIKQHSVIGADIIQKMLERTPTQSYLNFALMTARSHHERFDGKGYPEGLSGEDIPLCARIMAVADVYDALVDDRVYRKGMSHEEAAEIILGGRDTQFDGRIVDAFEAIQFEMAVVAGKDKP